jgi:hypothetical protein
MALSQRSIIDQYAETALGNREYFLNKPIARVDCIVHGGDIGETLAKQKRLMDGQGEPD